jgi:hypothetical protein
MVGVKFLACRSSGFSCLQLPMEGESKRKRRLCIHEALLLFSSIKLELIIHQLIYAFDEAL